MEASLEVRVDGAAGAIPAQSFADILRITLHMLAELDRAEVREGLSMRSWTLADLRIGSAKAVVRREGTVGTETPDRLVAGIHQLRNVEELPPFFSAKLAAQLVRVGRCASQAGLTGVTYRASRAGTAGLAASVTTDVVSNAQASTQAVAPALGSVSGVLDIVNLRRGRRVSLYDDETRRAIPCRFLPECLEDVRGALGYRVRAVGTVTRNRRGQVLRVDAEQVARIPDDGPLPSVADLVGIAPWYTGDLSTDDYLRWMRDEG